ncbi:Pre-mRNA-splicing factor 38, partial [Pavlovales sp. CCMP2436]
QANRTDPSAVTVHGTNPQYLVEKILRTKIYNHPYWKEHCFGLTDIILELITNETHKCVLPATHPLPPLWMLQIPPERDVIFELIANETHKYVRALAAFYMRLTGSAADVFAFIEPPFNNYRKLRTRTAEGGYAMTHMDEFAAQLLDGDANYACDIALPVLPKREALETGGIIE